MAEDDQQSSAQPFRIAAKIKPRDPKAVSQAPNPRSDNHFVVADPHDLAPAEDIIWRAIEAELQKGPAPTPENPLIILVGEKHTIPSHSLLQLGILERMAKYRSENPDDPARQVMYAVEHPRNMVERTAHHFGLRLGNHKDIGERLEKVDTDGRLAARSSVSVFLPNFGQISSRLLMNNAMALDIPITFTDARIPRDAQTETEMATLDKSDPAAQNASLKLSGRSLDSIDVDIDWRSGLGLALRNRMMVDKTLADAKEKGASIIIQHVGDSHVMGNKDEPGADPLFGMVQTYQDEGVRVLPVFAQTPDHVMQHELDRNPNTIILEGLSDAEFELLDESGPNSEEIIKHNNSVIAAEVDEIERLRDAYNGGQGRDFLAGAETDKKADLKRDIRGALRQAKRIDPPATPGAFTPEA